MKLPNYEIEYWYTRMIIADNTPEELARSTSKVRIHLDISKELTVAFSFIKNQQLLQVFLSWAIIAKNKSQ